MYDLNGKVAIVTGAGGRHGIGRAIALRAARDAARDAGASLPLYIARFPQPIHRLTLQSTNARGLGFHAYA